MKSLDSVQNKSNFSEILGILYGDGGLYFERKNRYQLTIAFNSLELQYLNYVKELFENYFSPYSFYISKLGSEILLRHTSKMVGLYLISKGFTSGNKSHKILSVPCWIKNNNSYSKRFIRGIFDTDGCIYRKYLTYLQIQFKFSNKCLLTQVREILINLGYNPTKIMCEELKTGPLWKIYLSRQKEIGFFMKDIRPHNKKNFLRYKKISGNARI